MVVGKLAATLVLRAGGFEVDTTAFGIGCEAMLLQSAIEIGRIRAGPSKQHRVAGRPEREPQVQLADSLVEFGVGQVAQVVT